jgi:hypothetical protein
VTSQPDDPCPLERVDPSPEVSACSDSECLLKFVELRSLLGQSADGQLYLTTSAIKTDDLKGGKRSVSTLRHLHTPQSEIVRRGLAINAEPVWADDPLGVIAVVASLRAIKDASARREVCVYAEPTTSAEDRLGACPTHAGLKRSTKGGPDDKSKLQWAVLRGAVANCFTRFVHVVSDLDVTNGFQK